MSNVEASPCHVGHEARADPPRKAPGRAWERSRHIKFLGYAFMGLMTMAEAARALNVSLATLDRSRRTLLDDGRQDTDVLRKIAQARRQCRSNNSIYKSAES
jgi:hypothetical protein